MRQSTAELDHVGLGEMVHGDRLTVGTTGPSVVELAVASERGGLVRVAFTTGSGGVVYVMSPKVAATLIAELARALT